MELIENLELISYGALIEYEKRTRMDIVQGTSKLWMNTTSLMPLSVYTDVSFKVTTSASKKESSDGLLARILWIRQEVSHTRCGAEKNNRLLESFIFATSQTV